MTAVYTTTSTVYRGPGTLTIAPSTTTVVTAVGTSTGTVQILFNPSTITTTTLDNGNSTRTSTTSQDGSTAGTIRVYRPSYTTVTSTSGSVGLTVTPTTASGTNQGTVQVFIPTPVTTCSNAGIQYAQQTNPYFRAAGAADNTYSAFQARAFQTNAPSFTGVTQYFEVPFVNGGNAVSIYGRSVPNAAAYQGFNHRGYLFAKLSGTYTFQFLSSDDISLMWLGPNAYGPLYNRANANIIQNYVVANSGSTRETYTANLIQGSYTPLRVLWANAGGDASFSLQIYAPDGELITNGTNTNSPYLVQFACNSLLAPQYVAWGREGV